MLKDNSARITNREAMRELQTIKEKVAIAAETRVNEFLKSLGLDAKDKTITSIVYIIKDNLKVKSVLEKIQERKLEKGQIDLELVKALDKNADKIQFYVTCAYLKRQDMINHRMQVFTYGLFTLTAVILGIMLQDRTLNQLFAGVSTALLVVAVIYVIGELSRP